MDGEVGADTRALSELEQMKGSQGESQRGGEGRQAAWVVKRVLGAAQPSSGVDISPKTWPGT